MRKREIERYAKKVLNILNDSGLPRCCQKRVMRALLVLYEV